MSNSKVIYKTKITIQDILVLFLALSFIIGAVINHTQEQELSFGDNVVWTELKDTQMDLWIKNSEDIYGIQFEFDGVNFISKEGGYLLDNKFEASHNERMILAFSFQGKAIPPGEHMLVTLNLSYLNGKSNVSIKDMVIAGEGGKPLDYGYFDTNIKKETLRTNQ